MVGQRRKRRPHMLSAMTPSMRTAAISENASVVVITLPPATRSSLEFLLREDHGKVVQASVWRLVVIDRRRGILKSLVASGKARHRYLRVYPLNAGPQQRYGVGRNGSRLQ